MPSRVPTPAWQRLHIRGGKLREYVNSALSGQTRPPGSPGCLVLCPWPDRQPVPLLRQLAGGDPDGCDDVVKYPLSLRNVEDLLAERSIDICHETARLWWNRFGPMFAAGIRRKRVQKMRACTHWRWHLDEVYVKINGEMHHL